MPSWGSSASGPSTFTSTLRVARGSSSTRSSTVTLVLSVSNSSRTPAVQAAICRKIPGYHAMQLSSARRWPGRKRHGRTQPWPSSSTQTWPASRSDAATETPADRPSSPSGASGFGRTGAGRMGPMGTSGCGSGIALGLGIVPGSSAAPPAPTTRPPRRGRTTRPRRQGARPPRGQSHSPPRQRSRCQCGRQRRRYARMRPRARSCQAPPAS